MKFLEILVRGKLRVTFRDPSLGSGCVTGCMASRAEKRYSVGLSDEELGDGDGGGVSGGAEGGAARRGHALAAVWADWC